MKFGGHKFLTVDLERAFLIRKVMVQEGMFLRSNWSRRTNPRQVKRTAGDAFETVLREAELYGECLKKSWEGGELCATAP